MNKILVTQSSMPAYEEYCNEIKSIWENIQLTNNGPKKISLENELCKFLDVKHIKLFTNGHLALQLGLQTMGLKGEVITTPFTFVSTSNAIIQNGLTPVFCDIEKDTYNIDVKKIESLITENTCAIMPVHVYGKVCNTEEIQRIADKHGLKVIYDAAHAFGVRYNGKSIMEYGDMSMISFHATKVFNTIEGGALVYNSEITETLSAAENFGFSNWDVILPGINAKMNEFQAAMGLCNLRHFNKEVEKRKIVAEKYYECLGDVEGLKLPLLQKNVDENYAYFPVLFPRNSFCNRDEIARKLEQENIYTRKYFYPIVTDYEFYKQNYDSKETPVARSIAENVLCLPMFADLECETVEKVCNIIKNTIKGM